MLIAAILAAALVLAVLSPLASKAPDGLERVARDNGFAQMEKAPAFHVIADYAFPWVDNEDVANALAGVTGVLLVAVLTSVVAFGLSKRGGREAGADSDN